MQRAETFLTFRYWSKMIACGISRCRRRATPAIVKEFSHDTPEELVLSSTYVTVIRVPACLSRSADDFGTKGTEQGFLLLH